MMVFANTASGDMAGQLIVVSIVAIIGIGIVIFSTGVLIQSVVWTIKKLFPTG